MATFDMIQAYQFALANLDVLRPVTSDEIKVLYALVKPRLNSSGFRTLPVTVGGNVIPATDLEHSIESLCSYQGNLSAREFYLWLEYNHPGNDGNGRVGAILFNLKNGTLDRPVIAPPYEDPRELARESAFGIIDGVPPPGD